MQATCERTCCLAFVPNLCTGSGAVDLIPCLDDMKAIKALKSRRHMEHREKHCREQSLRCLVPFPEQYLIPIPWPRSRDIIWFDNVPHPKLVEYKKDQNWVVKSGDYLVFPGGGTQSKEELLSTFGKNFVASDIAGLLELANNKCWITMTLPTIERGKNIGVILDVGCGVASFGGHLMDKNVITMSFAPKDEHEAQIQFALDISCILCFTFLAAMVAVTESICWKVVAMAVDSTGIGLVIYQKPVSPSCNEKRQENNPPLCDENDKHNKSWYVPLSSCLSELPASKTVYSWPNPWPERLKSKPPSLSTELGAEKIFNEDTRHWAALVSDVYINGLGMNWSSIRNVMDMNAGYGGFAAAIVDLPFWVTNVDPIDKSDTLPSSFILLISVAFFLLNNDPFLYFSATELDQTQSIPVFNPPNPIQNASAWGSCPGGAAAADYIPCLDNWKAIKKLKSRKRMEHRERLCPNPVLRCLVPMPERYRVPVPWPKSRDMIWYDNVPHPKLVEYKKEQNWVRKSGDYLVFPGGGTQFKDGVTKYVEFIEETFPPIEWGKHIRVVLDVGCGVGSFGGYLLDKNVITMSFAPKDEHDAQIQMALERGIPATLSVIATKQLTFPSHVFDVIHCARCRVHWHVDGIIPFLVKEFCYLSPCSAFETIALLWSKSSGGKPLLELNRVLRPGGFFIWSATPVYLKDEEHRNVWDTMVALTESMCWKIVAKAYFDSTHIGLVIFQKPDSSSSYKNRREDNPPFCDGNEKQNLSWYVPLGSCIPQLPETGWPSAWPQRLTNKPPSLSKPEDEENFKQDTGRWRALVSDVYMNGLGLNWSSIRNVMDMNAGYGGFAAALIDLPLWVINVNPINRPDTLSIIYDRGLIGIYHDWCEPFNTYPRSYDLLHSSFLFGDLTQRCDLMDVVVEMDRILRPGGWILIQDTVKIINTVTPILHSLHWTTNVHQDQFLVGKKGFWRPEDVARIT
ncbi:putative S-adenosyl-L-methionine-dependent methyltransferase [Dillenia turbinata]|uniref:S-adenosyl-L-methionine-dependent methyltransferase n=1 Tax=Dillenia turbinata TaxID=194707 RepID=A0AAN8VKY1_9MAGN